MEITPYNLKRKQDIKQLFIDVFTESASDSEGVILGDLTYKLMCDTGDVYGFTAIEDNVIIGCVFFSRLTFGNNINAYLLSPVAIKTSEQKKGIGQNLINYTINKLKGFGVEMVLTYGDPNYYSKVGFNTISTDVIPAPFKLSQPEGWLVNSLNNKNITSKFGKPHCVEAFNNTDLW